MTLRDFLAWLTTTAAGAVAYALIDQLPFLQTLRPEYKRLAAYVLTGGLATGAWLLQIYFGYVPTPADPKAWIEAIFAVCMAAFGIGQAIHMARDLPNKIYRAN